MENANLLNRENNDVVDRQQDDLNDNNQNVQMGQADVVNQIENQAAVANEAQDPRQAQKRRGVQIDNGNEISALGLMNQFQRVVYMEEKSRIDRQIESKSIEKTNSLNKWNGMMAGASPREVNAFERSKILYGELNAGDDKNVINKNELENLTVDYKRLKSNLKTADKEWTKAEKELEKARTDEERVPKFMESARGMHPGMGLEEFSDRIREYRKGHPSFNSLKNQVDNARESVQAITARVTEQERMINDRKAQIKNWKSQRAAKLREFNGCMKVGNVKKFYNAYLQFNSKQSEIDQDIAHLAQQQNNLIENIFNADESDI